MRLIGNIIWLVLGGFITAMEYFAAGVAMMITIIGIPFGIQSCKLGLLALWPFGTNVLPSTDLPGGCLLTLFNLIWLVLFGFWIALTHLLFGILLFLTILGIPFAKQHFKLAGLALWPFGKNRLI